MKVAELLFKNGFKEAYAIKGGVAGNKGWMVSFLSFLSFIIFFHRELYSVSNFNVHRLKIMHNSEAYRLFTLIGDNSLASFFFLKY